MRLLVAKGADVKAVDAFKTTTLMAAALGNDTDIIRMMIDAGVDVNAGNIVGLTPLMATAGFYGNVSATQMLLAKGTRVNARSEQYIEPPDVSKAGPLQLGSITPLLAAAPLAPSVRSGSTLHKGSPSLDALNGYRCPQTRPPLS